MLSHTQLFWSLPTPLAFCQSITDAVLEKRAILVNQPIGASLEFGIQEGLRNANIVNPLILVIEDGTNISNTLAPHFEGQVMHASDLAAVCLPQPIAVILRPNSKRAQAHCEKYMTEFVDELDGTTGKVRLILPMHDAGIVSNIFNEHFAAIVYDRALKAEEMQSYVSYCMLGKEDCGSTTLARQLVTNFASYDVELADRLVQMPLEEILNLPHTLTKLIAEEETRWSSQDWLRGSTSLTAPAELHPLREWYLASHASPLTAIGKSAAEKRYWRACLTAIIPWMEERRLVVLNELRPILQQLEPSGQFEKKVGDSIVIVQRDELEFNDLCYQHRRAKAQQMNFKARQADAFNLCFLAKKVRDELAHCRKPALDMLNNLIVAMDHFCRRT